MIIILIVIYILLGVHSVYYFIDCFTDTYDLKLSDAPLLVLCFLFPVITHFGTYATWDNREEIVLFKKKTNKKND